MNEFEKGDWVEWYDENYGEQDGVYLRTDSRDYAYVRMSRDLVESVPHHMLSLVPDLEGYPRSTSPDGYPEGHPDAPPMG